MTLPRDYDTWRLRGPEEPDEPKMEPCPERQGRGLPAMVNCETCHGSGEVEAEVEEYETERGDWLRDRRDGL